MFTRNDHPNAAAGPVRVSRSLEVDAIRGRDCETVFELRVKRPFDIALSLCALFLLVPALALIAVLVLASGPGPVICSQPRYGRNRKLFRMYRFWTLGGRVTRIGGFLRRTGLDELPQFVNVLKGDMSIVGPRPYAPFTLIDGKPYETVVADFEGRHAIRPGITSLARISGRRGPLPPAAAAIERFRDDLAYVRQQSLWLDFRIIAVSLWRGFLTGT